MRREVVWTARGRADYLAIIRYIAERNPDAAARIADRIDQTVRALGAFATGRAGRVKGTYEKVLTGLPYILAYELLPHPAGGEVVAILHVIHTARHWPDEAWPG